MGGPMTSPKPKPSGAVDPVGSKTKAVGELVQLSEVAGHSRKVYALGWNCSGSTIASGSTDKSIRLWPFDSSRSPTEMRGHSDAIHQLTWDPTHQHRLASTAADKTVCIWDTRGGRVANTVSMPSENFNIAYSCDGKYIAVSNMECISLIDTRKAKVVRRTVNPYEVNEVKFSKSGFLFAAAGHPAGYGTFEIMTIASNKKVPTLDNVKKVVAHSGSCFCLDFDSSGRRVAIGSVDSLVSIWDLEELYCIRTISRGSTAVRSVAFNYDGKFLASSNEDTKIDITEVESGRSAFTIDLKSSAQYICWHPKRNILAYVGDRPDNDKNRDRDGVIKMVEVKAPSL